MTTAEADFPGERTDDLEEEAIETKLLFAHRGPSQSGGPVPRRPDALMAAYQDDQREGEALELEPMFSRPRLSEHERPPRLTVDCQFWLTASDQSVDPDKLQTIGPLTDPSVGIRITIWDGRFYSMRWPPVARDYVDARSVKGRIVSPALPDIASDE